MTRAKELRDLLRHPDIVQVPGASTALIGRLIEQAGFKAVYMSGSGTAATIYGLPDMGLIHAPEMISNAARIAESVNVPVIADADTGYGNPTNVFRTVRGFEDAGVAGVHLEDQLWPKRCGHLDGKRLIPQEDMIQKIRAAIDARRDPDFVVIARCDALAVDGTEAAIERGLTYEAAGADVLMIESPLSMDDLSAIGKSFSIPLLLNMSSSGKTPFISAEEAGSLGFKLIVYPNFALLAGIKSMKEVLQILNTTGDISEILDRTAGFEEFMTLSNLAEIKDQERRYVSLSDSI